MEEQVKYIKRRSNRNEGAMRKRVVMGNGKGKGDQGDNAAAFKEVFVDLQRRWQAQDNQTNLLPVGEVARWIHEAACKVETTISTKRHYE